MQYFPNCVLQSGQTWILSLMEFIKKGTKQHPKWHPKAHNSPASAQFTLLTRYSMEVNNLGSTWSAVYHGGSILKPLCWLRFKDSVTWFLKTAAVTWCWIWRQANYFRCVPTVDPSISFNTAVRYISILIRQKKLFRNTTIHVGGETEMRNAWTFGNAACCRRIISDRFLRCRFWKWVKPAIILKNVQCSSCYERIRNSDSI